MSSCVCKILFKSTQVYGCYCEMFRGLTFLGHTVDFRILPIQLYFWGDTPETSRSVQGGLVQTTPTSAWLDIVPIVPVLRHNTG